MESLTDLFLILLLPSPAAAQDRAAAKVEAAQRTFRNVILSEQSRNPDAADRYAGETEIFATAILPDSKQHD